MPLLIKYTIEIFQISGPFTVLSCANCYVYYINTLYIPQDNVIIIIYNNIIAYKGIKKKKQKKKEKKKNIVLPIYPLFITADGNNFIKNMSFYQIPFSYFLKNFR